MPQTRSRQSSDPNMSLTPRATSSAGVAPDEHLQGSGHQSHLDQQQPQQQAVLRSFEGARRVRMAQAALLLSQGEPYAAACCYLR
jgi:hypothetical protein